MCSKGDVRLRDVAERGYQMSEENDYEHLGDIVRNFANRMVRWFHCFSRGGWANPPIACFSGDLADSAFRDGKNRRVV